MFCEFIDIGLSIVSAETFLSLIKLEMVEKRPAFAVLVGKIYIVDTKRDIQIKETPFTKRFDLLDVFLIADLDKYCIM